MNGVSSYDSSLGKERLFSGYENNSVASSHETTARCHRPGGGAESAAVSADTGHSLQVLDPWSTHCPAHLTAASRRRLQVGGGRETRAPQTTGSLLQHLRRGAQKRSRN